jgi:transcriptional regulator with XRE-family HTH domain
MDRKFSKRLIAFRKNRRLTISEVAERIEVPLTTYREWEYGRAIRGEPYVRLAEVFGVTLYELLTGENPTSQSKDILKLLNEIENQQKSLRKKVESLF